eukprot:GHVN01055783.1.p1 GENE.GHVN01055783.1~~GHVN01055783.1.p1  ORF type:complete len:1139 (+),score=258.52 GHVN01055783.1:301-3717(+)
MPKPTTLKKSDTKTGSSSTTPLSSSSRSSTDTANHQPLVDEEERAQFQAAATHFLRQEEEKKGPQQFHIQWDAVEDVHHLSHYEHWMQMGLFTTDLHVVRAWRLMSDQQEQDFKLHSRALSGPIVYCWSDLGNMPIPQSLETILSTKSISLDIKTQVFEAGTLPPPAGYQSDPVGTYRYILIKIALGRCFLHSDGAQGASHASESFVDREIPAGYSSVLWETGSSSKITEIANIPHSQRYRVLRASQVLCSAIVEIEFKPLRVDVAQPVCEMCEIVEATVYCPSDLTHLCDDCDQRHHSATTLLSRHERLPATQSPFQFGMCPDHPAENINCVCLACFVPLCAHCVLIGHHSNAAQFSDHPLASTLEVFKMAQQGKSPSEDALEHRRSRLVSEIRKRQIGLSAINSNFDAVQRRIDSALQNLVGQLREIKSKKVGLLQALRRELLSDMLLLEWFESFYAHLQLALSPSDFLLFKKRHDFTATSLFGGPVLIDSELTTMPQWMSEKVLVRGSLRTTTIPYGPHVSTGTDKKKNPGSVSVSPTPGFPDINFVPSGKRSPGEAEGRGKRLDVQWVPFPSEMDGSDPTAGIPPEIPVVLTEEALDTIHEFPTGRLGSSAKGETVYAAPPSVRPVVSRYKSLVDTQQHLKDRLTDSHNVPTDSRGSSKRQGEADNKHVVEWKIDPRWDHQVGHDLRVSSDLWVLLSDNRCELLVALLKTCKVIERAPLIRDVCDVCSYVSDFNSMMTHLITFELHWSSNVPPSLLLTSSTLLTPLLTHVTNNMISPHERKWIDTLATSVVRRASDMLLCQVATLSDETSLFPALTPLLDSLLTNLTQPPLVPPSVRAVLYILASCFNSHITKRTASVRGTGRGGGDSGDTHTQLKFGEGDDVNSAITSGLGSMPVFKITHPTVWIVASTLLTCLFAPAVSDSPCPTIGHPGSSSPHPGTSNKYTATQIDYPTAIGRANHFDCCSAMSRMIRNLGHSVWGCPTIMSSSVMRSGEAHSTKKISTGIDTAKINPTATDLPEHDEVQSYYHSQGRRVCDGVNRFLSSKWVVSPIKLDTSRQPKAARLATGRILAHIREIDQQMRLGELVPPDGLSVRDLTQVNRFEDAVSFSVQNFMSQGEGEVTVSGLQMQGNCGE